MLADSGVLLVERENERSGFSVVFEDDGRVAYAYLLDRNKEIVADVWVYNSSETPREAEWSDRQRMPFVNPADFVRNDVAYERAGGAFDVEVGWEMVDISTPKASVFIQGKLLAVLTPGAKPGWSLLAAQDGPLAKVLELK
jgi:hypothetical protein